MSNKKSQNPIGRRKLMKVLAGIPFLPLSGALGMNVLNETEKNPRKLSALEKNEQIDQLTGKLPVGKLSNLTVRRMILGCNPIIAWSHARDLIYPNRLMKAYNTDDKIIET